MDTTENRVKYCHLTDEEKAMFLPERKKDGIYRILKNDGVLAFCADDERFNQTSVYQTQLVDGEWYYCRYHDDFEDVDACFKRASGSGKTDCSSIVYLDDLTFKETISNSAVCSDRDIITLRLCTKEELEKIKEQILNTL